MKKVLQILITIFIASAFSFAQSPDTAWTRTFGGAGLETGYDLQQTDDGGYILVGDVNSSDIILIKTDVSGNEQWTKIYGGSLSDLGNSVIQTNDGGFIIVGNTASRGAGLQDVWLIKTDSNGDSIWTKTFGGPDSEIGYSVQQTSDNGYIITGYTRSFSAGQEDVWLIKTDSIGNEQWNKIFGGTSYDKGYSVQQTSDGGYIITGETASFGLLGDVWLIKTDSNGNIQWTKTFGANWPDAGYSVNQTSDGGFIIAGQTDSFGAGSSDFWLIKTNSVGDTLWTKTFGSAGFETGRSVKQTTDGGYIVCGFEDPSGTGFEDVLFIKTDSDGNTQWTKSLGGTQSERSFAVIETTDDGFALVGYTSSFGLNGDVWLVKLGGNTTGINSDQPVLKDFSLLQNYPNPFNPVTKISWQSPTGSHQTLKIYDLLGNEVATLVDENLPAGNYDIDFDASGLTSGIYFYQLKSGSYFQSKKMLLLK
ncbi:MAG: T9SS type A sorting domain-containing protein [Ignavibacteriaceae bacterium]